MWHAVFFDDLFLGTFNIRDQRKTIKSSLVSD